MMWNYRIVDKGNGVFGLHEVYYDDQGVVSLMDEEPTVISETVEGLILTLQRMLNDAQTYKDQIIDLKTLK
jgi:hypothetical protein